MDIQLATCVILGEWFCPFAFLLFVGLTQLNAQHLVVRRFIAAGNYNTIDKSGNYNLKCVTPISFCEKMGKKSLGMSFQRKKVPKKSQNCILIGCKGGTKRHG